MHPGPVYGAGAYPQQFPPNMYGQPMGGNSGMPQQQQPQGPMIPGYGVPSNYGVPQQGYPPRGPSQNYGGSF